MFLIVYFGFNISFVDGAALGAELVRSWSAVGSQAEIKINIIRNEFPLFIRLNNRAFLHTSMPGFFD